MVVSVGWYEKVARFEQIVVDSAAFHQALR